VPDPFSGEEGARLYRTGDLGRFLGDGAVGFLGRRDRQLKIRGFRVETGEIEATLCRHPAVSAAVVVPHAPREGEPGGLRLVAYVVGRGDDPAEGRQRGLQDFLHGELPAYMVPHVIQEVDSLPRGPNGKVDLGALPDPEAPGKASRRPYEAPRDAVEELVVELWRDLLGTERIGVRDDFFELGGHSLLAMQLLSRLRRTFAAELPLAAVFDRTTVGDLADALKEHEPSPGHLDKVARVHLKVRSMSGDEVDSELRARAGVQEGVGG
jgi:acyl carrier protein